jgi:hypothetical protein
LVVVPTRVSSFAFGSEALHSHLRFACRHWANEIVVLLEMPFDRLGLSTERAHSLRLEPGCCLLLKTTARLLSHHLPPDGASLLQCAVHSFSSNRRKLVLPELKFSVVKSKPGELGKFVAEAARSEASAVEYNQEFALRWSLEHLLNSLLASTLAAESSEHLPERIAKGTSLPYVRELHQHLSIDSEEYCKQESLDTLRKKALEAAVAEAASQPKMEWPDCAEEQREVDGNLWLRLLHFLREQVRNACFVALFRLHDHCFRACVRTHPQERPCARVLCPPPPLPSLFLLRTLADIQLHGGCSIVFVRLAKTISDRFWLAPNAAWSATGPWRLLV